MDENQISIDKFFDKKITISLGRCFIVLVIFILSYFVIKSSANHYASKDNLNDSGLEIEGLIRQVKIQLMKADSERIKNNENALFKLKDFQMEISFMVSKKNTASGKMDYKFVTVEGGTETGNEKVQKLILNWEAIPEPIDSMPNGEEDTAHISIINIPPK